MHLYLRPSFWFAPKKTKARLRILNNKKKSWEQEIELLDLDTNLTEAQKLIKVAEIKHKAGLITDLYLSGIKAMHGETEISKKMAEADVLFYSNVIDAYEREVKKLELLFPPGVELEQRKNNEALSFGKIDKHEHAKRNIDLDMSLDATDKALKKVEYDYDNGLISDTDARLQVATWNKQPFIAVSSEYDPTKGIHGLSFSFTWNDFWVKTMSEAGYSGDESEMMEKWFTAVCRSVLLEEVLSNPEEAIATPGKLVTQHVDNNVTYIR